MENGRTKKIHMKLSARRFARRWDCSRGQTLSDSRVFFHGNLLFHSSQLAGLQDLPLSQTVNHVIVLLGLFPLAQFHGPYVSEASMDFLFGICLKVDVLPAAQSPQCSSCSNQFGD